tara:strand:- start:2538 stop:2810 length:273 start_codon:yes stop_codon:yes gene_type:complete
MACCKKHKRQRFIKQTRGFIRSLYLNIKSGFKHVTHEEYEDRISICMGCPFVNYKEDRCNDCGCYIKIKARLKVEDCPQGYWRKLYVHKK